MADIFHNKKCVHCRSALIFALPTFRGGATVLKVGLQFRRRREQILCTLTFCLPGRHETRHCTSFVIV